MDNEVITVCPVCKEKLGIKNLYCNSCNTEISGSFYMNKFNYLSKEHLSFIEIFLKNRGNIKDVEKELNISYPSVRRLLDEVIIALGYKTASDSSKLDRMEILRKLENGDISVEEATDLLKK